MSRISILAVATVSLLLLGAGWPLGDALGQDNIQHTSDIDRVNAMSQVFMAAIAARDIRAMDKVWAHEPYATFIGPLSTTVVTGWEGVRKAWEMRFGQFDRVHDIVSRISRAHPWEGRLERRGRKGRAATEGRKDPRLRCLRDERV